jgi:hypothetical protein
MLALSRGIKMQAETLFSSASGVHYTPADIASRARAVMNGIELDPASDRDANKIIQAERYYTALELIGDGKAARYDGLAHSWRARSLWLNPPFSIDKRDAVTGEVVLNDKNQPIRARVIAQWVERWRAAIKPSSAGDQSREAEHAMLLVPARTDTSWFQPLFGLAMCFVSGRLTFSDAKNGAPFPTAIVYSGPSIDVFYTVFSEVGECGRFSR